MDASGLMKLWWLLPAVILAATGCGKSFKVNNPVVGPAPPRIKNATEVAAREEQEKAGEESRPIAQVAFAEGITNRRPLSSFDPVARVNGTTLFVGDILGEQMMQFEAAKGKAPPEEIRKAQDAILKEKLQDHIDQQLMVDAVKVKLKAEQLEGIEKQLDEAFEKNMVPKLMEVTKAQSVPELESMLQTHGLSLPQMRKRWGDQQIAMQWIKTKAGDDPKLSRPDLLAAYEARIADYTEVGQVKWQHIQVILKKHGDDRDEARLVLDRAIRALRAGQDFDAVARSYSEAGSAADGGHWDWTQTGSLANRKVADALDSLPVDEISDVIDDGKSLQIVRVTARRPQRIKPFDEEVQKELKAKLLEEDRKKRTEDVIKQLRANGAVETIFDETVQS